MGSIISKPKDNKQKREGLMTQMRSKTEDVSPSKKTPTKRSPSPPPRRLSSTLESASLTKEFLTFLKALDKASLVPDNECGRAESLQFVLEVKQLRQTKEEKTKSSMIEEIGKKYFSKSEEGKRISLENSELYRRCSDQCANLSEQNMSSAEENMSRAHDSLISALDDDHILFLENRRQTSRVDNLLCLL